MKITKASMIALAFILSAPSITIAGVVVSTDRFGYTGSVSTEGSPPYTLTGNRDLGLYIVQDPQPYDPFGDINQIQTAWYYTTDPNCPSGSLGGCGNPSNALAGFVQMYDPNGSTDTQLSGFWSADLKTFTLNLKGENATDLDNRLWNGVNDGLDFGVFIDYSLNLTAQFNNVATENSSQPGFYELEEDPISVSGSFSGNFRNDTGPTDYAFNFTLNMTSWATENASDLVEPRFSSYFGSSTVATVVPEPTSLALLGLGLAGLVVARRRNRRCVYVANGLT